MHSQRNINGRWERAVSPQWEGGGEQEQKEKRDGRIVTVGRQLRGIFSWEVRSEYWLM